MPDERPRVLLVEDDPALGPMIESVLAQPYRVTLAADGESGLRAAGEHVFAAMVIDRRLPDMDGLDIVRRLRADRIATPILMLTALGTLADKVEGLDAGADDYLVKPFEFDELLARLRALTRTFDDAEDIVSIGSWEFFPSSRAIHSPYGGRIQLTARESALLQLLAEHPGRTFSRAAILDAVFDSGETLGTVDTYVHYVRRKTDQDLVATVRGEGYRLGQP